MSDFNTKHQIFKDTILKLCEHRTDDWSNTVKFRVLSVISDLSAAGALYHKLCYIKFKTFSVKEKKSNDCNLEAFQKVCQTLNSQKSRFWTSLEIEELYSSYGGEQLDRRTLVDHLDDHFKGDLIVLSSKGMFNILAFKNEAAKHMKLNRSDGGERDEAAFIAIAIKN